MAEHGGARRSMAEHGGAWRSSFRTLTSHARCSVRSLEAVRLLPSRATKNSSLSPAARFQSVTLYRGESTARTRPVAFLYRGDGRSAGNPLFGAFRLLVVLVSTDDAAPGSRPAEEQKRVTRTKTDDALNLGHLQTGPFKALNETNFVRNLTEAFRQLALSSSLLAPPSPVLLFLPTTTNNHKKRRTASAHLPAAPATLTLSFFSCIIIYCHTPTSPQQEPPPHSPPPRRRRRDAAAAPSPPAPFARSSSSSPARSPLDRIFPTTIRAR